MSTKQVAFDIIMKLKVYFTVLIGMSLSALFEKTKFDPIVQLRNNKLDNEMGGKLVRSFLVIKLGV